MNPPADSPSASPARGWKRFIPEGIKRRFRPCWQSLTRPPPATESDPRATELARILHDASLTAAFAGRQPLPPGFGHGRDERCVEYPWLLARLSPGPARALDLGSALNHDFVLQQPPLAARDLTIATLEPEEHCFWKRRISYVYCDARALPFRDEWFDEIISISTLEHIGMDNARFYSPHAAHREADRTAWLRALGEAWRVLKPGGTFLLTVPFGRAIDYGWFQQFDRAMLDLLLATLRPARVEQSFFRYAGGAWITATRDDCADALSFHGQPGAGKGDTPKACGAVAALDLRKPHRAEPAP